MLYLSNKIHHTQQAHNYNHNIFNANNDLFVWLGLVGFVVLLRPTLHKQKNPSIYYCIIYYIFYLTAIVIIVRP